MKKNLVIILVCLAQHPATHGQSFRESILKGSDREALLSRWIADVRGKSESELIANVTNPRSSNESKIASAVLLLKEHDSIQAHKVALTAFGLEMPAGVAEWESANDWKKLNPVAAVAATRPKLMPVIVESAVAGNLPEQVATFVLLQLKATGTDPADALRASIEKATNDEQRQRNMRLLSIVDGTRAASVIAQNQVKPVETTQTAKAPSHVPNIKPPTTPSHSSKNVEPPHKDASEEPASSTPWSVVAVLILAALGLLWLLFKRRS